MNLHHVTSRGLGASHPRNRRPLRFTGAAVLLVGALSACGGDDEGGSGGASGGPGGGNEPAAAALTHEEYIAEIEKACAGFGEKVEAMELNEEPEDPAAVADSFDTFAQSLNDFADDFAAVEPPEEDAETAEAFQASLRKVGDTFGDVAGKARDAASMEEVEALETELPQEMFDEADAAMVEVGFEKGMQGCVSGGSGEKSTVEPTEKPEVDNAVPSTAVPTEDPEAP